MKGRAMGRGWLLRREERGGEVDYWEGQSEGERLIIEKGRARGRGWLLRREERGGGVDYWEGIGMEWEGVDFLGGKMNGGNDSGGGGN